MTMNKPGSVFRSAALGLILASSLALGTAPDPKPVPKKVPFLGVVVQQANETLQHHLKLPRGAGLTVQEVTAASPADQAGVRQHDVLERIDDQLLFNPPQLRALVRSYEKGQTAQLKLWRDGERKQLEVTIGETEVTEPEGTGTGLVEFSNDGRILMGDPTTAMKIWRLDPSEAAGDTMKRLELAIRDARPDRPGREAKPVAYLGVQLKAVDASLATQLGLDPDEGALVIHVVDKGPAATTLKEHDVLLEVDGAKVSSPDALVKVVRNHRKGDQITLKILRAGKPADVTITLDERPMPDLEDVGRVIKTIEQKIDQKVDQGTPSPRRLKRIIIRDSDDNKTTTGLTTTHCEAMVIKTDDDVITVTRTDGHRNARVETSDGKVLFDGPINTDDEMKRLPPGVRQHIENLKEVRPEASPSPKVESIELLPSSPKREDVLTAPPFGLHHALAFHSGPGGLPTQKSPDDFLLAAASVDH